MALRLNAQGYIERYNTGVTDGVVARPQGIKLTSAEIAELDSLPVNTELYKKWVLTEEKSQASVSRGGIFGGHKLNKMVAALGRASAGLSRVNIGYHGHSIALGVDATNAGTYNATTFAAWNTQSQAAILARLLAVAVGGTASSASIMAGGTGGVINPLLTVAGGAYATADGAFGPGGWRLVFDAPTHTASFVAVGTQIRVYCAANGAGSTVPLRWSAPSVSAGATQTGTLPAAAPNPGNTPAGTRTWNEFTIGPVVAGETVTLIGPASSSYSVYFIDNDYRTAAGVTVHRLAQSGASMAELHASAIDNTDTTVRFSPAWLGSAQANVRLTQQQSMSVRVPMDGIILQTDANDLNDWAAYGYTLADLSRHLSNYLAYHASIGLPVLVVLGPIRDPAFSVGTRPYNQADLIAAYKAVIDASTNAAYLDITAPYGGATSAGYAAQVAAGLMQDVVHPNQTGHAYWGAKIAGSLLNAG